MNIVAVPLSRLQDTLSKALDSKHTAFVMSERFVNLPVQLAVPLFETVLRDMEGFADGVKSVLMIVKLVDMPPMDAGKKKQKTKGETTEVR